MTAVRVPGGVRVGDLAAATGTSAMTIRRDLAQLERQGIVRRTHGGATSVPSRGTRLPFSVRLDSHVDQKQAIAALAAELIPDGSSVIVDTGTTCATVAQALAGRDLTVLALSVHIAVALGERPGVRILTPGGALDGEDLSWVGHASVRSIQDFRADAAILGVCAWDEKGLTASASHDAERKRALVGSSNRVIAVATAEKFDTSATFAAGEVRDIDTLITDRNGDDVPGWVKDSGVEVLTTRR